MSEENLSVGDLSVLHVIMRLMVHDEKELAQGVAKYIFTPLARDAALILLEEVAPQEKPYAAAIVRVIQGYGVFRETGR